MRHHHQSHHRTTFDDKTMEESPLRLSLFAAGIGCFGLCIWRLREWYRVQSFGLRYIPGPDSESRTLGSFAHTSPPSHTVAYSRIFFDRQHASALPERCRSDGLPMAGGIRRDHASQGSLWGSFPALSSRYSDTMLTCGCYRRKTVCWWATTRPRIISSRNITLRGNPLEGRSHGQWSVTEFCGQKVRPFQTLRRTVH